MAFLTRARVAACLLVGAVLCRSGAAAATVDEARKTLLLLPVASGSPGQEWSAKALGGVLEEGFGSLPSVRLVAGTARETALRELAASDTVTPEAFQEICRRAGADLAILGGSTREAGSLSLEVRIFDVGAGRELPTFLGEEAAERAFDLVEKAIRHVVATASLGAAENLFPRGVTASLEAYAAYRAALLEQDPAGRVEKLREAVRIDADYADPTRLLGVELFRQGSLDEALKVLERAVTLGPKVAEARNNYGVALAAAGRAEQAQREFEEAVALAPGYAEARVNLARVFEDRGRSAEAEKQYDVVLEADAGNDKARAGRAALYDRTGRADLAVKEFRLLSSRRPDLAEQEFVLLGQEARKSREFARAEKFFLRATDINPQFSQAWAELGTNSYLAGQYAKGVEYFRRALAIDPGQAQFHYFLGLALDKGRQQDEALREYRRAVELGGPPEARLGLARAALESGDPGLAVEELNRLLVASPEHAEAKLLLAQATSEMEARRRLVEGQSQFANQRLARLEQIVADANRTNRELEARLQALTRDKQALEEQALRVGAAVDTDASRIDRELEERLEVLTRDKEALEELVLRERAAAGVDESSGPGKRDSDVARLQGELAVERVRFRREIEDTKTKLAASEAARAVLERQANEAVDLKGRLLAAQMSAAKAEAAQGAERERGERALAAEREDRRAEVEKLRSELAAGQFKREEKNRLLQDRAAANELAAAAEAAREKAAAAHQVEAANLRGEIDRIKADLASALDRAQDRDVLARALDAERARALAERTAREKVEQALSEQQASSEEELSKLTASGEEALSELRASSDRAVAAGREEMRRQGEQAAEKIAALETQVRTQAQELQAREAELESTRSRENALAADLAKSRADLGELAGRYAALEVRAAAEARALAERERALEQAVSTVREFALELGRIALRTQSWEKAREYLEQAAAADPRSGEAWYGLGEVYFQLGQYEKSKQMYDKAKQIY